jgi:hypothetical protein
VPSEAAQIKSLPEQAKGRPALDMLPGLISTYTSHTCFASTRWSVPMLDRYIGEHMVSICNINNGIKEPTNWYQNSNAIVISILVDFARGENLCIPSYYLDLYWSFSTILIPSMKTPGRYIYPNSATNKKISLSGI